MGQPKAMVEKGTHPMVSIEIGGDHGRERGRQGTYPTPDVLGTGHLSQLLASISPTESRGGRGGRRSLESVKRERDGGVDGILCHTSARAALDQSARHKMLIGSKPESGRSAS